MKGEPYDRWSDPSYDVGIDTPHRLSPHHIFLLKNYMLLGDKAEGRLRKEINEYETYRYDDDFVESLVQYLHTLTSDPDTIIEVVDGLDSFCDLGCNRKSRECLTSSRESKEELYWRYRVEIGDTITVDFLTWL